MMKTLYLLVTFLICVSITNARSYDDTMQLEEDEFEIQPHQPEEPHHNRDVNKHPRHRRKRQYGYWNNYVQEPWRQNYNSCPEREILAQMMKIMTLMLEKEKPNVIVNCGKEMTGSPTSPDIGNRVKPPLEDPNMNWGFYTDENKKPINHDQYTRRPINLEPYKPKDDGVKDNNDFTTRGPPLSVPRTIIEQTPNICDFAYVACCDRSSMETRRDCFANLGCHVHPNEQICDPRTKQEAFNFIAKSFKLLEE